MIGLLYFISRRKLVILHDKSSMGKKIVYVIGGLYSPNGMAQVLSAKANYLAGHTDYRVHVILTEKAGTPFFYPLSPKIETVNFDINFDELDTMPIHRKIFRYLGKQRKYRRCFRNYLMELRPDITVTAMRREINFINRIPDGSKKVGEIHFNKENYRQFRKKFLPERVNRAISNYWMSRLVKEIGKLSRFVVLSNEDRKKWSELDRVEVIHNPLSHFPEVTSRCEEKKVLAAGRYLPVKGFDLLIKAWEIVHRSHPGWELFIHGHGDRAPYQALAAELGIGDSVHCREAVKDIYAKYQESSLFVLSSRHEGFGLVLAEAMSCGLPVVSFDCPSGPREIISEGEDGLLAENGNVGQLAAKISYLIEHPEVRRAMGAKARANAARFGIVPIMQQWIQLFDEL